MRPWIALLATILPACGFQAGNGKDGGDDVAIPPDAQQCFGSFATVCLSVLPTAAVNATDGDLNINTDVGSSQCDAMEPKFCVVAGTSFTIATGRKIRGHGARPLVLVSITSFQLTGEIDVSSSHDGALVGPGAIGAGSTTCMAGQPPPSDATQNSGGFGGSFGGKGGDGEQRDGGRGVAGAAVSFPPTLRGGCPGGTGGGGGAGGNGGGALAIIAVTSIQLDGRINASGAGGHGGPAQKSGGGGGGSGGMIVLEAPRIAGAGSVFANGGGGGQGGATNGVGTDGGESLAPSTAASGGSDNTKDGGSGGVGSSGAKLAGVNAGGDANGGGGGGAGGGGAGFIRANGATAATTAPPPQ